MAAPNCGYCVPEIEICGIEIGDQTDPRPPQEGYTNIVLQFTACLIDMKCDKSVGQRPGRGTSVGGPTLRLPDFIPATVDLQPPYWPGPYNDTTNPPPPPADHPHSVPGAWAGPNDPTPLCRGKGIKVKLTPIKGKGPLTELVCCEDGRGGKTPGVRNPNDPPVWADHPETTAKTCCEEVKNIFCACIWGPGEEAGGFGGRDYPRQYCCTAFGLTAGEPVRAGQTRVLFSNHLSVTRVPPLMTSARIAALANKNKAAIAAAILNGLQRWLENGLMSCGMMQNKGGVNVFTVPHPEWRNPYGIGWPGRCLCTNQPSRPGGAVGTGPNAPKCI